MLWKTLLYTTGDVDNSSYKNYNLWQNLIYMRMSCVESCFSAVYYE